MAYTTTNFIETVKNRAMLPDASAQSLSPEALLIMASEELQIYLVPTILSARQHYYEIYEDFPIVQGQAAYPIPSRAVGGVVSLVQWIYDQQVLPLPIMDPSQVTWTAPNNNPANHYYENNDILVYPTPSAGYGSLRIRYFQRCSNLVVVTECAQITSVDFNANTVDVTTVPSDWAQGTVVDFIPETVPYRPFGLDYEIVGVTPSISGYTIEFSDLPDETVATNWLSIAGTTPIPEIPQEFRPVLAQMTAIKALEATGDAQGVAIATDKLTNPVTGYLPKTLSLISPRNQSQNRKIVPSWRSW